MRKALTQVGEGNGEEIEGEKERRRERGVQVLSKHKVRHVQV